MKFLLALPLVVLAVLSTADAGFLCNMCKIAVKDAEDKLNSLVNADEGKIQNIIDNDLCARLGPAKGICKTLVKKYLPLIVREVEKHEGNLNLCALLHLCSSFEVEAPVLAGQGPFCAKCQAFVQDAEDKINNLLNADEAQIMQILDNAICTHFGAFQEQCKNMISMYIPKIIQAIENGEGNINICAMIKLCSEQMNEGMVLQARPGGSPFCGKCQALVKDVENKLNNMLTGDESQIMKLLDDGLCSKLGPLQGICKAKIAKFIPKIIAALEKGEGNINICAMIKLCGEGSSAQLFQEEKPGFGCDICKGAWDPIEGLIKDLLLKLEMPVEQKVDYLCKEVAKYVPFLGKPCNDAVADLVPDVVKWLDGVLDHLPFCQDIHLC